MKNDTSLFQGFRGLVVFVSILGIYLFLMGCGQGFSSVVSTIDTPASADPDGGTRSRINNPPYLDDGDGSGDDIDVDDGDGDRGEPTPTPTPQYPHTKVFTQQEYERLVDILFVVDNSGSMGDEQENIADNFERFIDVLATKDYDFRIAITTTDIDDPVIAGKFRGNTFFEPGPLLQAQFISNIDVGVNGSGSEKGLEAARKAIQNNSSFLRADAVLNLIFVSDEQDLSGFAQYVDNDTSNVETQHPEWTPAYYRNQYLGFKGDNASLVRAHAIVATMNDYNHTAGHENDTYNCPNGLGSIYRGLMNVGTRYINVAQSLNGEVESICSADFSDTMEKIGLKIISNNTFALDHEAIPSTIEVRVNSVLQAGYQYVAVSRSIVFNDNSIPPEGATVEVKYKSYQQ